MVKWRTPGGTRRTRVGQGQKPIPPGPNNPLGTRWMGSPRPASASTGLRTRLDRLLRLARVHPYVHRGRRVAVQHRRHRDDGVHRRRLDVQAEARRSGRRPRARLSRCSASSSGRWSKDDDTVAKSFEGERTTATDFTLERLNGDGSRSLSSFRGKVVVINFWAAWCVPCKSEAPRFQAAYERYRDRVEFVGVDTADFTGDAPPSSIATRSTTRTCAIPSSKVLKAYGGLPIPRTFFVAAVGSGDRLHLRGGRRGGAATARSGRRSRLEQADRRSRCSRWRSCGCRRSRRDATVARRRSRPSSGARIAGRRSTRTNSGSTREIVRYIEGLIAAGAPKSEIKNKAAEQYGWRLPALPSKTDGPRPTLTDLEGEVMCPVVQHDARPVELARRAADQDVHLAADPRR